MAVRLFSSMWGNNRQACFFANVVQHWHEARGMSLSRCCRRSLPGTTHELPLPFPFHGYSPDERLELNCRRLPPAAARKLGMSSAPVIELAGLTEAQKQAYIIRR